MEVPLRLRWGRAPRRFQDAHLRYIKRAIDEAEVIASMEPVDVFIDAYEGFLDICFQEPLGAPQRQTIIEFVEKELLVPLRRFLSVLGAEASALSSCYSTVADALVTFQRAVASESEDPVADLVRVLSRFSQPWQAASVP